MSKHFKVQSGEVSAKITATAQLAETVAKLNRTLGAEVKVLVVNAYRQGLRDGVTGETGKKWSRKYAAKYADKLAYRNIDNSSWDVDPNEEIIALQRTKVSAA